MNTDTVCEILDILREAIDKIEEALTRNNDPEHHGKHEHCCRECPTLTDLEPPSER